MRLERSSSHTEHSGAKYGERVGGGLDGQVSSHIDGVAESREGDSLSRHHGMHGEDTRGRARTSNGPAPGSDSSSSSAGKEAVYRNECSPSKEAKVAGLDDCIVASSEDVQGEGSILKSNVEQISVSGTGDCMVAIERKDAMECNGFLPSRTVATITSVTEIDCVPTAGVVGDTVAVSMCAEMKSMSGRSSNEMESIPTAPIHACGNVTSTQRWASPTLSLAEGREHPLASDRTPPKRRFAREHQRIFKGASEGRELLREGRSRSKGGTFIFGGGGKRRLRAPVPAHGAVVGTWRANPGKIKGAKW